MSGGALFTEKMSVPRNSLLLIAFRYGFNVCLFYECIFCLCQLTTVIVQSKVPFIRVQSGPDVTYFRTEAKSRSAVSAIFVVSSPKRSAPFSL